jgi:hypothetical protein
MRLVFSEASKCSPAFDYIGDVLDKARDCIDCPFDFAAAFVKSKFIESTMFLYLVDEWTGEPVTADDGVYPVEIDVQSEQAKKIFPLMALGMQALALTNTAAGIINMFFPVVPSQPFPKPLLEKARRFIEESHESGVVKQVIEKDDAASETVRGLELREFVMFLEKKDPDRKYSGLRKICDASSGKAIWVTEESANRIADENEAKAANDNIEEDSRLRAEIHNVEENNQLKEEVSQLRLKAQQQAVEMAKENSRLRVENSRLRVEKTQKEHAKCCIVS